MTSGRIGRTWYSKRGRVEKTKQEAKEAYRKMRERDVLATEVNEWVTREHAGLTIEGQELRKLK